MNELMRIRVAALAHQMTSATLDRLAAEVEAEQGIDGDTVARISSQFPEAAVRHEVRSLLEEWIRAGDQEQGMFAEAMRSAAATVRWRDETERSELVWSGPLPTGSHFRRTDEALLQVVRTAQRRVSLVTFAAYRVTTVAEALRDALHRGVEVRFFGETEGASEGRLSRDAHQAFGAELSAKLQVFEWPSDLRGLRAGGRQGLLHAKFALADESTLFVSSANLTESALEANMELGVLLTGGALPVAAAKHLDRLIAQGLLCQL